MASMHEGGAMNGDSLASMLWSITRLQLQYEAVIAALEKKEPGFYHLVAEEMKQIQEQGRLLQIAVEIKHEIDQVSEWTWLKAQGIKPDTPQL
jgi:hypothetical protein